MRREGNRGLERDQPDHLGRERDARDGASRAERFGERRADRATGARDGRPDHLGRERDVRDGASRAESFDERRVDRATGARDGAARSDRACMASDDSHGDPRAAPESERVYLRFRSPVDPSQTRVSSRYQESRDITIDGRIRTAPHQGIDYAPGRNIPYCQDIVVRAAAAGTVRLAGDYGTPLGNQVNLVHEAEGATTRYGHLSDIFVTPGQRVEAGAPLGTMGNTGRSTGRHLHFEIRQGTGGTFRTTTPIRIHSRTLQRNWNHFE